MSKETLNQVDPDMLPEYDFSGGVRGKYAGRFKQDANRDQSTAQPVTVELRLDAETLTWFKAQGEDYEQRMRAALRLYAETHRQATAQRGTEVDKTAARVDTEAPDGVTSVTGEAW